MILDKHYRTAYEPIIIDDEIVGAFFIGVSEVDSDAVMKASRTLRLQSSLGFIALIILVGYALNIVLERSIRKPVLAAVTISEHMADYDLPQSLPEAYLDRRDEVGKLAQAMETIQQRLRKIITDITAISVEVTQSSEIGRAHV